MFHHRVYSAKLPWLSLMVIGLSLLGIGCDNPIQAPPTFQDKFNKIEVRSNETSGMTLNQVRETIGRLGEPFPLSAAEKLTILNEPSNTFFDNSNIGRLSRYRWQEFPEIIIVFFFDGNAVIKAFLESGRSL